MDKATSIGALCAPWAPVSRPARERGSSPGLSAAGTGVCALSGGVPDEYALARFEGTIPVDVYVGGRWRQSLGEPQRGPGAKRNSSD
jgi:NADH:ubiquinone oxidoreductase subunit B-like Fe-S oxidoreductase